MEALLDLVRSPHSPWALPGDSSTEDRFLRELAIRDPLLLNDSFFCSYFRTLRVVDKEVRWAGLRVAAPRAPTALRGSLLQPWLCPFTCAGGRPLCTVGPQGSAWGSGVGLRISVAQ